jgi:preprotein translocase subunit YajC
MKDKLMAMLIPMGIFVSGSLLAQDVEPPPPDQSFWQTLVMIGIAFLFFYVILWRPEQKRRKALEEQRSTLKKGDRVVAMGILGTIVRVGDQTVIVKMYDGAKIEFYKAAISDVLPEAEESAKKVENIAEEDEK